MMIVGILLWLVVGFLVLCVFFCVVVEEWWWWIVGTVAEV